MTEPAAASGFVEALRAMLGALPARRRTQLWRLNLLTLANAAADMALVASAMLVLAAVSGQALPAPLAHLVGGPGAGGAVDFAALAFAASALAANGLRLLQLKFKFSEAYVAG